MKKVFTLLLCLALLFTAAQAANEFSTARDLWNYWSSHPEGKTLFPDYVCGVWSTDGSEHNLTIGVTGEEGKQAVLDAIADTSTVTIVYQTYPRNYLLQVQDELLPLFEQEIGMVSTGLDDRNNRIVVEIHADYRENDVTKKAFEAVYAAYGDAVVVTFADGWCQDLVGSDSVLTVDTLAAPLSGEEPAPPFSPLLLLIAAAAFAVLLLLWNRRKVLQTVDGPTAADSPLTLKETAKQVIRSEVSPSPALDETIRQAVKK